MDDYNGPRCMGYFQLIGFGAPPHHSVPTLVQRTDQPCDRVSAHVLVLVGVTRYGRFGEQR